MQSKGLDRLQLLSSQVSATRPVPLESAWDFLHFDQFLTEDEIALRKNFRKEIMKFNERMPEYLERTDFPFQLIGGLSMKGYGCAELSLMASAAIAVELHRADGSLGAYFFEQCFLGMMTIYNLGSEAQKKRFLPDLASLKKEVCWGLTEPGRGSDASGMKTEAKPTKGGFILNGKKRWIGSGTHADVLIIFARNTETKKVQAFILTKDMKGIRTKKIHGKWAFRSVQKQVLSFTKSAQIFLTDVFVPDELVLPKGEDFRSVASQVLRPSRLIVAWSLIGLSIGCWDAMMKQVKDRKAMGKPLMKHQLVQEKITRSLAQIQSIMLLAKRGIDLLDKDQLTIGQVSLIKGYASLVAREVAGLCREVMGGDGILIENQAMKHMNDIEVYYTGQGTYDINMLVAGREITGQAAFK